MIPLWHHELVYEHGDHDIYVIMIPDLPDNICIDANNNLVVNIYQNIQNIWKKEQIYINIHENMYIERKQLLLRNYQMICLKEKGISKINSSNVYDIQKKSDIILHIHLRSYHFCIFIRKGHPRGPLASPPGGFKKGAPSNEFRAGCVRQILKASELTFFGIKRF